MPGFVGVGSFGDTGVPCVTTAGSADSTPPPEACEGANVGGDEVKETLATVISPWLAFSGWTESELCVASTLPLTCTFCHCRPMSPKPPSANWLATIRPLLVASLLEPVAVTVPAAPLGVMGVTAPVDGAVDAKPGVARRPNCFWPVVIELTLSSPG